MSSDTVLIPQESQIKMNKTIKYPVAMTLRIETQMADEIEEIAGNLNLSKAAFIRRSIRRAVQHSRKYELPLLNPRVRKAIRP
jgi:hypothetical protein